MTRFAIIPKLFLTASLLYFSVAVGAQQADDKKEDKEAVTKKLVESRHYMFVPQSMTPLSGRTRQIDYGYDLRVISDTVNCYLPYAGKSFTPDYGGDGSIRFKTTEVDYKVQELKKGKGWTVTITPTGVRNVRQITLHVTSEGRTSIDVTSNTRDMISFNGFVQEIR
jgi:Domain of unknown function (DUF4251)